MNCSPNRLLCPLDFPGKNTGVSCYFLLQGIFPIQGLGLNQHLLCHPHWQADSLSLSLVVANDHKMNNLKWCIFTILHLWRSELLNELQSRYWRIPTLNYSILKEINPEYSLKWLMLKLNLQYFGHLMLRADSLENTLMLGKIEGRRRRGDKEWNDCMSSTQWTWVSANSGR